MYGRVDCLRVRRLSASTMQSGLPAVVYIHDKCFFMHVRRVELRACGGVTPVRD